MKQKRIDKGSRSGLKIRLPILLQEFRNASEGSSRTVWQVPGTF